MGNWNPESHDQLDLIHYELETVKLTYCGLTDRRTVS